jgi:hypothetical protein
MRAVSAALARICDGRRAISFGNSSNFLGTGAGPNIFRMKSGRIILPKMGEMVWLMMSPIAGIDGGEGKTTSPRKVG